jgi:hypothetical protein
MIRILPGKDDDGVIERFRGSYFPLDVSQFLQGRIEGAFESSVLEEKEFQGEKKARVEALLPAPTTCRLVPVLEERLGGRFFIENLQLISALGCVEMLHVGDEFRSVGPHDCRQPFADCTGSE